MRVLLVSLNRYRNPTPVMPLGACLVAEAAAEAGHDLRFLDLLFSRNPRRALQHAVLKSPPDVVGLSLRNIDNNDLRAPEELYGDLQWAVDIVRRNCDARIVAGGGAFGVMPEPLLRLTGVDLAVLGDGDKVFPQVLDALGDDERRGPVPGTAWMENGEYRYRPGSNGQVLNGLCAPDYARWIDVKAYLRSMSAAGVQTKRGCEFKCAYCTYGLLEGTGYRFHPLDSVIDNVRRLVRNGMRDIEFVDSVFNAPYDHAISLCDALASSETGARFQTLELNPRFVDDRLLTAMEWAGFVGMGITAESVSDAVLEGLGKEYGAEDVHRAADAVREASIPCTWIFLLGGPGETRDTVRKSLRFAAERVRPSDVVFFNLGVRIYPGTKLEQIAREQRVLDVEPTNMLRPVFYLSPELDPAWLADELDAYLVDHLNALGPSSIGLPFLPLIHRMAHRLGVRLPLWKHTRRVRRLLSSIGVRT